MKSKSERYIIPNIARALKILEMLSGKESGGTVSEISQEFDIPVNSTFRIIKSLKWLGYIEEVNRKYFTTPRLLYLGYAGLNKKGIVQNALDQMHRLRDEINETVMLGTMVSGEIVIIEQLPSFEFIKFTTEIGRRVPVHASAPGKAILAFMPEPEAASVIDHLCFDRYNDKTIPGKKALLAAVEETRKNGYAIDFGEEVSGIICIAAPVLDVRGLPVASVWTTGPDFRIERKGIEEIGKSVVDVSDLISKRLGSVGNRR